MNNNQVLTCHQCDYHLQDKDLSDTDLFTNKQILLFQNYQNKKVLELYNNIYGTENTLHTNSITQQPNGTVTIDSNDTLGRKCDLCLKQHSYGNIFVLNCNCKMCYDCFANEVNQQRSIRNELLSNFLAIHLNI